MPIMDGFPIRTESNKWVCASCFDDDGVKNFIRDSYAQYSDKRGQCSYCQNEEGVGLGYVVGHIYECLSLEWVEIMTPTPSDDDEYPNLIEHTAADVLMNCNLGKKGTKPFDDIVAALSDTFWIPKFLFEGNSEDVRMVGGWKRFCDYVKHRRRYFFLHQSSYEEEEEEALRHGGMEAIVPHDMLNMLSAVITRADAVGQIRQGESIYRARVGCFREEADMREPPPEKAVVANRMSPAGISMFYGCYEPMASLRETYDRTRAKDGDILTVGEFAVGESIDVFDLSGPWEVPSLFDKDRNSERQTFLFMREFAKEIAKRVSKGDGQDIEYVPTQILTEYLRTHHQSLLGKQISGIAYSGVCVALFDSAHLKLTKPLRYYRTTLPKDGSGVPKKDKKGLPIVEFGEALSAPENGR